MHSFMGQCKTVVTNLGLKKPIKTIFKLLNPVPSKVGTTQVVSPAVASPFKFQIPDRHSNERIKYAYYGNDQALVDVHYGAVLLLNLYDNSVAPTIMRTGWWEPWIDILINSIVKEGNKTIDVGANFGYHTLLQAKLVGPQGKVFAFECNPLLIPNLIRSTWISGFSGRVDLHHAAVTNKKGEIDIYFNRQLIGGGGIMGKGETADQTFDHNGKINWNTFWASNETARVKTVALDELLQNEIDFIHTDAEGAEPLIFEGARNIVRASRNLKIISEWSVSNAKETNKSAHYQMVKNLADDNFKFYVINPPQLDVYTNPPTLRRVELDALMNLPHCDLFITRN